MLLMSPNHYDLSVLSSVVLFVFIFVFVNLASSEPSQVEGSGGVTVRTVIPEKPHSSSLLTSFSSVENKQPSVGQSQNQNQHNNQQPSVEHVNINDKPPQNNGNKNKLLVISFDGFRHLYLANDRFLPWFAYFRSQGVYSELVQSIFPSETFPNHYAIVTGRYAESHGIVANDMYDPPTDTHFTMENTDLHWWNETEPIWVTARRQGIKTAVSFWPGSAVVWQPGNLTPDYSRPVYDNSIPYQVRIDEVVSHLAKDGVQLGLLYYNRPDVEGHYYGVESVQVATTLQQLDWYLSYIIESTRRAGLGPDVLNIVVCADHGMVNITTQLYLESYVSMSLIERVPSYGAVTNIQVKPGQLDRVYDALSHAAAQSNGQFRVFKKKDVPTEFHYSNNPRIGDIVVIAEVGVYMSPNSSSRYRKTASHGYDPKFSVMQPIFMARGPAFKTGGYRAQRSFRTKDIYAVMTHIIGMEPFPNNSTFADLEDLFAEPTASSAPPTSSLPYFGLTTTPLIVIYYCYLSTSKLLS